MRNLKAHVDCKFRFGPRDSSLSDVVSPAILEKFEEKFDQVPAEELFIGIREVLRFLFLSAHAPSSLFFPGNRLLDDIWHALVIETYEYKELCNRLKAGVFIHHSGIKFKDYAADKTAPRVHEEQFGWLSSYVANFGPIEERAFELLPLAKSLADRMSLDLNGLNGFAQTLIGLAGGIHDDLISDFSEFLAHEVRPQAHLIDRDPCLVRSLIIRIARWMAKRASSDSAGFLTNEELEDLFGASTALAFTYWQHLAALERLNGLLEWQKQNSELWSQLTEGEVLCGLATTHLARPGGSPIHAVTSNSGYSLTGIAKWVCGFGIFDKVLVGFETSSAVNFAIIDFPEAPPLGGNHSATVTVNQMVCLNGTSTVSIDFHDYKIAAQAIVSTRDKTDKVLPRPSRYKIPEIGIAKNAVKEVEKIVTGSRNPRHQMISESIAALKERLARIDSLRMTKDVDIDLIPLRDDVNRDAVWLLGLTTGADALVKDSLPSRLQLELMLLDCVIQSPQSLRSKIQRACQGSNEKM